MAKFITHESFSTFYKSQSQARSTMNKAVNFQGNCKFNEFVHVANFSTMP